MAEERSSMLEEAVLMALKSSCCCIQPFLIALDQRPVSVSRLFTSSLSLPILFCRLVVTRSEQSGVRQPPGMPSLTLSREVLEETRYTLTSRRDSKQPVRSMERRGEPLRQVPGCRSGSSGVRLAAIAAAGPSVGVTA